MAIYCLPSFSSIMKDFAQSAAGYAKSQALTAAYGALHSCSNFASNAKDNTLFTIIKIKSLIVGNCCKRVRYKNKSVAAMTEIGEIQARADSQAPSRDQNARLNPSFSEQTQTASLANTVAKNALQKAEQSTPAHSPSTPMPALIADSMKAHEASQTINSSNTKVSPDLSLAGSAHALPSSHVRAESDQYMHKFPTSPPFFSELPVKKDDQSTRADTIAGVPASYPAASTPPPPSLPQPARRFSFDSQRPQVPSSLLEGPRDMNECPGLTNVLYDIGKIRNSISRVKSPHEEGEVHRESVILITQSSFSFLNAVGAIALNIVWLLKFLKNIDLPCNLLWSIVEKITIIGGLLASLFELVIEICHFRRVLLLFKDPVFSTEKYLQKIEAAKQKSKETLSQVLKELVDEVHSHKNSLIKAEGKEFFEQLHNTLINYQNEINSPHEDFEGFKAKFLYVQLKHFDSRRLQPSLDQITKIKKHSKLSDEMAKKEAYKIRLSNLSRRIGCEHVDVLQKTIDNVLNNLRSPDGNRTEGIKGAKELIKNLDIQCRKAIIVHVVALVNLLAISLGLAFAFAAFFNPFILPASLILLPTTLFWGGFFMVCVKYCFGRGLLATQGWKFSWYEAIKDPYEKTKSIASYIIYPFSYAWERLSRTPDCLERRRVRALTA